jgi:TPP-dependent pyruvate/acetoin dehydrogenase alpha subunit
MPGYVVDGNDLLAVYQVVSDCVERARAGDGPSLIEAITYRLGAHSTADDPTKYRPESELQDWLKRDPIPRFRNFLLDRQLLSEEDDRRLGDEVKAEIQEVVAAYEALPPPDPGQLFDVVYAELPPQLRQQRLAYLQSLGRG